jgi:hypothetical protein
MWEYELFILSSQVISISRHTVCSVPAVDRYKVYQDIPSTLFLQWTDTKYIKTSVPAVDRYTRNWVLKPPSVDQITHVFKKKIVITANNTCEFPDSVGYAVWLLSLFQQLVSEQNATVIFKWRSSSNAPKCRRKRLDRLCTVPGVAL